MDYWGLCDKIENGNSEEKNEAELELMSRWYYGGE